MSKKISIHYHTECSFFAGCESMLANFFNSDGFRRSYNVTFSYVQSKLYNQGLQKRVIKELPIYPNNFPNLSNYNMLPEWLPLIIRRIFMAALRLLFNIPLLIYQVFILFHLFKKISPDILHINNGGYPAARSAIAAAIAGKLAGIPQVLMVVNNMAADYRHYSRWIDYPIDRIIVRCVNVFITGSKAASTRLRNVLNLPEHQVIAINNGINMRALTSTVATIRQRLNLENFGGVVFGVVALLIPRKGHQVLLDAILKLVTDKRTKNLYFKVLIEGEGPLHQTLVDFVEINNLASWITFVGEEKNVVDFMAALDVLILPSVQDEDFPNVILEAMSLAKPVIASRLAGTPEQVIEGVTGLLVEPRNVAQLGEAIFQLIDNTSTRNSMGHAGLRRFNSCFTSQIALDNYSNLYTALIEDL